jgi:probable rRNA maturation factor
MPARVDVNPEAPGAADAAARLVERAVRAALEDHDVADAELSVTLLDDAGMAALNRQWKGKEAPTDVLAFPLHEPGETLFGDIYVGFQRAVAQAAEVGESTERELCRLAIHGTLHVLGFEHPEEEREATEMWAHQERILEGLGVE